MARAKLFSRKGIESYSVCEGIFGIFSVNRSVNGRASYLGGSVRKVFSRIAILFCSFDLKQKKKSVIQSQCLTGEQNYVYCQWRFS